MHQHDEELVRQRAVERDIFRYMLGYGIDKDVMDEVQAGTFASKLTREELNVTYQFFNADEKQGLLRLRTHVTYRLKNQSTEPINYPLKHYFHSFVCPPACSQDQFTDLVVTYLDQAHKPQRVAVEVNRDMISGCSKEWVKTHVDEGGVGRPVLAAKITDGAHKEGIAKLVRYLDGCQHGIEVIEPLPLLPGREVEVQYAFEQIKRFADAVTLITTHPAKKLVVEAVLCDPSVAKLKLEADSAHRLDPVKVGLADKNNLCFKWLIPSALLRGQGTELYWYPEEVLPKEDMAGKAAEGNEQKGPAK